MSVACSLDTSALVKRYIAEPGTEALTRRCFASDEIEIFVSALAHAETYATLTRLMRDGDLSTAELDAISASFEDDWSSFVVVELAAAVRKHVPELARRHALRGADLVQLASAVHLRARGALDLFVACDLRLANAAVAIDLPLFNPEVD